MDGENGKMLFDFLFCQPFGPPVNRPENWKSWERRGEKIGLSLIMKLFRA